MPPDPRIQALFDRWQEARRRGEDLSLQELCHDCPELAAEVEQRIKAWDLRSLEIDHAAPNPGQAAAEPSSPELFEVEPDKILTRLGAQPTDRGSPKSPAEQVWLHPGAEPVPGYRLVSRLGGGASGEVWKAMAPGDFPVAMKFIRLGDKAEALEVRSLEFMKEIHHAHLLALFGAWQTHGLLVVAMELGDRTLVNRLEETLEAGQPGIPFPELSGYMHDAAEGIDFLNEPCHNFLDKQGVSIQHRDIKPQNLLLVGRTVKVADFGLAKLLDQSVISNTGGLTVAYAAPEFFQGKTFTRSDQYSLAVTYCQLRGGRLPFTGIQAQIMAGHLMQPPDLTMLPEPERPVVERALAKRPEERWPSCRAFVRELENAYAGTAPASPLTPVAVLPPVPVPPRARRRLRALGTVIVLGVAGGLGLAWGLKAFGVVDRLREYVSTWAVVQPPTQPKIPPTKPGPRPTQPEATIPTKTEAPATKPAPKPPAKTNAELAEVAVRQGLDALGRKKWDESLARFQEAVRFTPGAAPAHVGLARAFFGKGEYDAAFAACDTALRHGADAETVALLRGDILLARGDYGKAVAEMSKALAARPDSTAARTRRGIARYYRNDFDGAVEDCTEAIRHEPENALAFAYRAGARAEKEDNDGALNDCGEALRFDPDQAMAKVFRAWLLFKRGRVDRALEVLDRLAAERPELADVFQARARVYRLRNRPDKAAEDADQARADVDRALQLNPHLAHAYVSRAMVHLKKQEFAPALAAAGEAIRLIPDAPLGYLTRGIVRKSQGQDTAADFATALAKIHPQDAGGYYNRGLVYVARGGEGDTDAARADFTEAIRLNPDLADAFDERGNLFIGREEYTKAIADFERARELCPEKGAYASHLAAARFYRGQEWYRKKEYAQARDDFRGAVDLEPANAVYLTRLGNAHYELENDAGAAAWYAKAVAADPKPADPHYRLGLALLNLKKYTEAAAAFTEAVARDPNKIVYFEGRREAYEKGGDKAKARADQERIDRLKKGNR